MARTAVVPSRSVYSNRDPTYAFVRISVSMVFSSPAGEPAVVTRMRSGLTARVTVSPSFAEPSAGTTTNSSTASRRTRIVRPSVDATVPSRKLQLPTKAATAAVAGCS
ncbi:hypothetical protein SAMN04489806_1489 [Paramicrobacterium humi]|uniref:Uncharacterized protein n=1 Tax=Paramicrobacterium humi TaxID=640635 RepID=A0A1H4LBD9_9MICO|nr:hypothetical protein [Microbacterium humi]SEB68090.1 hypothetical protein SAMN04489806_1489 [Microbacterium humi]